MSMAFSMSMALAKPPARKTRSTWSAASPSRRSKMRCPEALEALAWASWLASEREKVMPFEAAMVKSSRPSMKRPSWQLQMQH